MSLAARIALVVIAIAILDEAFVHPAAGTDASDHLVSGVLPASIALVLAALLPRVAPLARGLVLLAAGALAVTAGVSAGFAPIVVSGAARSSLTAAGAGVAGCVLVVAGVDALWVSRRRDGGRARRWARRTAIAAGAAVAGFLLVLPVALAIVATHGPRRAVHRADLGRPYERTTLTTSDGLRLHGWYVPSRNRAAVVVIPGRDGTVPAARMLARHGYGVLLFDPRGQGESDGDRNAFGWSGEADVAAALSFLRRRDDVDPMRIAGIGLSVGGELLLQTAAHSSDLRAVVSEGAGRRSMAEQLDWPGLPAWQRWISPMLVQTAATAVLANASPPTGLTELVGRIDPRPVLLVRAMHGNADEVLNRVYLRAGGRRTELWEVPVGGHTGALAARPHEYERRVVDLLEAALHPSG